MRMPLYKAAMATAWLLASGSCYRAVFQLFGFPKPTFARTVHHICQCICNEFQNVVNYNKRIEYFRIQRAKFAGSIISSSISRPSVCTDGSTSNTGAGSTWALRELMFAIVSKLYPTLFWIDFWSCIKSI